MAQLTARISDSGCGADLSLFCLPGFSKMTTAAALNSFRAWFLLAAALFAPACGLAGAESELDLSDKLPPNPLNFVFILADDLRYDALGVVQRELGPSGRFPFFANSTPRIDGLIANPQSIRFNNAMVVQSLCSPSRAAFLTGMYNHLNGIANNHTFFPLDSVTYATSLKNAGYATGYFGKWHMGKQVKRPGFTSFASFVGQGQYFGATYNIGSEMQVLRQETPAGWVDDSTTDYALEFIESHATQPFLAVIGFKAPHHPRTPPSRTTKLFSDATVARPANFNATAPWDDNGPRMMTQEGIRNYFRTVAAIDNDVGRVLDKLTELNIAEKTVVVFTSDNGFFIGEHGLGDKRAAYEESIRIPFIIKHPQITLGAQTNESLVLNIDLAPTFLAAAGLPKPASMQGKNLLPLMKGDVTHVRSHFLYEYFQETGFQHPHMVAYRGLVNKITQYPGHPEWEEVYQVATDPLELSNVAQSKLILRDRMRANLEKAKIEVNYKIPSYADPNP